MVRSNVRRCATLAAALVACFAPSLVRADALDVELMKRAPEIRDYLLKKQYRGVGVLSFRLQRGTATPSFRGGQIIQNLPERLETALIVALDESKHPLKVAHHAAAEAGKHFQGANYRTEEDRTRLFNINYPQAWGNPRPRIALDVFLTGKVVVAPNLKTVTVEIEAFDRADPAVVQDVLRFQVPVDRHILADVGQGFSMSTLNKGRSYLRAVSDDDIVQSQSAAVKEPKSPNDSTAVFASTAAAKSSGLPIRLMIYYDDVEQPIEADLSAGDANYKVRTPTEGEVLEVGVENLTDQALGLVLTVNGLSTLYEEKGQADKLKKWILQPGQEYRIKGYYRKDDETYKLIKALSEEASVERYDDLGGDESAGLIYAYVFRPVDETVAIDAITTKPSIRRMSEDELVLDQTESLSELQQLIVPGKFNRSLFSGDWGDTREEAIKTGQLGPVQLTDTLIVRYYAKPK